MKSDVDKLDTDKLKNVRSKLRNLKTKVEKLNIDKLITVPGNISKLRDVVKIMLKRMYIVLRSKILRLNN